VTNDVATWIGTRRSDGIEDGFLCGILGLRKLGSNRKPSPPVSHTRIPVSTPADSHDYTEALDDFLRIFRGLPDARDPRGLQYDLVFVLAAAAVAVLAGAASVRAIADQIGDLPPTLLKALGARWCWFRQDYRHPSVSTLRDIFARIDVEELERRIGHWLATRAHLDPEGLLVLALDGKVLRGAWLDDHQQFTLFSAMIHDVGVTIGQVRVPADTTEVTQVEALIDMIPALPERTLVTLDAAHTHATTAQALKGERRIDFIFTVKSNQPNLLAELITRFKPVVTSRPPEHIIEERGHGRKKRWSIWTLPADGLDFPHLQQIACIQRETHTLTGTYIAKEFAFPITSAERSALPAAELNNHVRKHWGIEAKSHWVRDTVWHEDHNQSWKGNTPHVMAVLKNLAASALRLVGFTQIKASTESIARDRHRAIPILAIQ